MNGNVKDISNELCKNAHDMEAMIFDIPGWEDLAEMLMRFEEEVKMRCYFIEQAPSQIAKETSIVELKKLGLLSDRAFRILTHNAKFESLGDVCACSEDELKCVRNMGSRTLFEVEALLSACGLDLKKS